VIHLKSTSGASMYGLKRFTQFVVDELAVLPFSKEALSFKWPSDDVRNNNCIYVSPSVDIYKIREEIGNLSAELYQMTPEEAQKLIDTKDLSIFNESSLPRFDLAIIGHMDEFDAIVRPGALNKNSLVRAKGIA
jgi:hypothetical protein